MAKLKEVKKMTFQEFERQYGHLLSWEDAEKKVGRRLDWNNNFDCCLYHDLLIQEVNKKILDSLRLKIRI